jgi:hypothetical protein
VSTSKEIVVQDACVLFDLIELGLMHPFFELDLKVLTTIQVIGEIEDLEQLNIVNEFISSGKLGIDSTGLHEDINEILTNNSGLSFADSSVLALALRINGSVLSSDLKLRHATIRNKLTVRGVLWVLDELHTNNNFTTSETINRLKQYQNINDRAPRMEIKAMIDRLSKIKE